MKHESKDPFIHKHGYSFLFKDPEFLKRLIRDFVDKDFYNQLNFKESEPLIEKSYLTDEYREFSEDLVYKIKLQDREAYIYILMEFQSSPDRYMSLRLLNYVVLFYLDYIRDYKSLHNQSPGILPPVFPLLLYNGNKPWNVPDNVKDLIEQHDFLHTFYPDFSYFKIIERNFSEQHLKDIGSIISTIFLMERCGKNELRNIEESFRDVLEKEDIHVVSLFTVWLKHLLLHERLDERAYIEAMGIKNKKESKSMLVESIHKWEQELREKGREEGIEEERKVQEEKRYKEKIELVKKGKRVGLSTKILAEMTGLSEDDVNKL